jgi:hypothetical protein
MQSESLFSQLKPLFTFSLSEVLVSLLVLEFLAFSIATSALHVDSFIKNSLDTFTSSSKTYEQYEAISVAINSNQYVADGVVFLIWACIGLGLFNIFLLVRYSEHWFVEVAQLVKRGSPAAQASLHERVAQLSIRSLALIVLIILIILSIRYVLPLLITLLDTSELRQVMDFALTILATWLIMSFVGHAFIVFLRCLMLRSRLIPR